jgi:putative intracellular protease/amidase
MARKLGFRLGIYVFKDAEIVDYAAPAGVISVARRLDPELDTFLIAESMRPVQTQAGFTVLPNYSFADQPTMDAFLIPGGFGTRQEMNNTNLHRYIRALPPECLLTSVCTGSWIYARMGLLDGLPATNRGARPAEALAHGQDPHRPPGRDGASLPVSRARVVDAGAHRHRMAASPRAWRWVFTSCGGPATTKPSSTTWPGSWNTSGPTSCTGTTSNSANPTYPPFDPVSRGDCHVCVQDPFSDGIKLGSCACGKHHSQAEHDAAHARPPTCRWRPMRNR